MKSIFIFLFFSFLNIIVKSGITITTRFTGLICNGNRTKDMDCYPDHGNTQISQEDCEKRDCCFDSNTASSDIPWCYNGTMINIPTIMRFNTNNDPNHNPRCSMRSKMC